VAAYAAIGVDDDLAPGQPGVALGAAGDEPPGRIDQAARCSKRMLNGPCGGSEKGKCEVSPDTDCGWHLIYERLKELGQLDYFSKPADPKDWVSSRDGGPRKIVREDVRL